MVERKVLCYTFFNLQLQKMDGTTSSWNMVMFRDVFMMFILVKTNMNFIEMKLLLDQDLRTQS